jgi:hypothetical protein
VRTRLLVSSCAAVIALAACAEAPTRALSSSSPSFEIFPEEPPAKAGGCPADFVAAPVKQGEAPDRNADGTICVKTTPSGHQVRTDNASVAGHSGECPPEFLVTATMAGNPRDRNENGTVCVKATPSGEVVVVDDDNRNSQ